MGSVLKRLVRLGLGAGRRIDLLQLADGKGRLLRVGPCMIRIKIGKLRLPVPQLLDDQSHLKAPVPQVDVSDHLMAHKGSQPLYALADHGGTQMAYMKGLGYIGPAVIHNNRFFFLRLLKPQLVSFRHLFHIAGQKAFRQL